MCLHDLVRNVGIDDIHCATIWDTVSSQHTQMLFIIVFIDQRLRRRSRLISFRLLVHHQFDRFVKPCRTITVIRERTTFTAFRNFFLWLWNIRREPSIFAFISQNILCVVFYMILRPPFSFSLILFILCTACYFFIFVFYLCFEFNDSFIVFCTRSFCFLRFTTIVTHFLIIFLDFPLSILLEVIRRLLQFENITKKKRKRRTE